MRLQICLSDYFMRPVPYMVKSDFTLSMPLCDWARLHNSLKFFGGKFGVALILGDPNCLEEPRIDHVF